MEATAASGDVYAQPSALSKIKPLTGRLVVLLVIELIGQPNFSLAHSSDQPPQPRMVSHRPCIENAHNVCAPSFFPVFFCPGRM